MSAKQIDKLKLLKKLFTKFSEASFFSFLKKKPCSHTKKIQSIFFCFGLKDNFFFSPTRTSKKKFVYNYKNPPAKNRKKPCLLANSYANEHFGHPPRNIFSLFYSLLKLFWLTKIYLLVWRNFKWTNLTKQRYLERS